jgi:23S rRNA (uracil1939-C5)-methyltransferase
VNGPPGGAEAPPDSTVSLAAEKLVGGGRAIAHHDGSTWMVAGALPGERVRAEVTRRRAGIIEARTVEVLSEPHPARLSNPCPRSEVCGGCDWPHVDPIDGAKLKAAAAAEAARSFPELARRIASAPIHHSQNGYRLRARLHWDGKRKLLGFYEGRSHDVVSISPCRILSPRFMEALPAIEEALSKTCGKRTDLDWLEGSAPGDAVAALRPAKGGPGQIDAAWVPGPDDLGRVVAGFHCLSDKGLVRTAWGATEVEIELPIALVVPVGAFFQGNRHLIGPFFERVAELVGGDATPVYDLHAGVGYLAAAARHAGERELTLVEPNRDAAMAARRNLPGAQVVVASTAEAFVAGARDLPSESIVITDPPRSGLSKALRRDLAQWRPRRILMLGCDPATWARDAGFLCDHGYQPLVVEVFDLFPSTHHLEILALLERA